MALVEQPRIGHQRALFKSIFPSGLVRPPKIRQQFETSTEHVAVRVCELLTQDSRTALGIENFNFRYGPVGRGNSTIPAFCSYYSETADVDKLSEPSHRDKTILLKRFEKLPTWQLLSAWRRDLGLPRLKKIFAAVIDQSLTAFVEWSYSRNYGAGAIEHLIFWIEHILMPYTTHFLSTVDQSDESREMTETELEKWKEMAVTRLATLRVNELFEMIIEWDESAPGIDDLKHYTTNPATRSYVTSNFANVIGTRLLHPGASTIEILQVYISIIRAFRRLDPKGVLLERVSRKIRRYLRERDDTIKIVVAGLLSDYDIQEDLITIVPNPDILVELSYELQQHDLEDDSSNSGNELDWNNMDWVPDPIDAAPDYMRSMNTDVVGSVISLFESKDIFVRELQTALAERLLRNKTDFDQEISVVEHLKIRFGDNALQACEVMLRDVHDSRKLDQVIRKDQGLDNAAAAAAVTDEDEDEDHRNEISMHAKILSRLFWPALPEQPFTVPLPILEQRNRYEKGFESLKQTRKLTWNDAIGQVEVELELADRTFHDEVLPYQATVIYAFQDEEGVRTVADLAAELSMSPALVRSACLFWQSKRILRQTTRPPLDAFAVLETLPPVVLPDDAENSKKTPGGRGGRTSGIAISSSPGSGGGVAQKAAVPPAINHRDIAAAEAAAAEAIREAEAAERKQKLQMYHQFVVSMLTNQGAMPLPRIAMMLGIVVPGGFPFSNEELREFLSAMVREGVVEVGPGGNYKVAS